MGAAAEPDAGLGDYLRGRHIVLGISGGIAAYKCAELVRLLIKAEARVRVMMTANAREFIGPLTLQALSGKPVCTSLFNGTDSGDGSIHHIEWAREADAVVLAPATANLLGKLANGVADDALSTFLMAVTSPILVCPAMNTHMLASPAVQRNLATLKADGRTIMAPDSGEMACGTSGPGRLPDPCQILERLAALLSPKDFGGQHVLITAGPTQEPMDPVRYVTNPSSGKMGYALARAAEHRGAAVTLITGPTALVPPKNVAVVAVRTAAEMAEAVFAKMAQAHVMIMSAAVSDYRPIQNAPQKMKKGAATLSVEMERTTDILATVGAQKKDQILVGFAAETEHLDRHASGKLTAKNADLIVGNRVDRDDAGFRTDTNQVTIYARRDTAETLPLMPKTELAHLIMDRVAALQTARGMKPDPH